MGFCGGIFCCFGSFVIVIVTVVVVVVVVLLRMFLFEK